MRVYGISFSVTTRQVLTLLREKQHDVELVVVDVMHQAQRQLAHLSRHPFGRIPVLADEDFVLYETPAILRYLERRLPMPSLTPREERQLARMDQWLCIEQAYLQPAMKKISARNAAKLFQEPDPGPEIVEQGRAELARVLDVMARRLDDGPYLAGDDFSLADLVWMTYRPTIDDLGCAHEVEARPSLANWWDRVCDRPAWLSTLRSLST